MIRRPPRSTLFPYRRSSDLVEPRRRIVGRELGEVLERRAGIGEFAGGGIGVNGLGDRKSTRLNSSHTVISYAVFCLKKKKRPCLRYRAQLPHRPREPSLIHM